MLQHTRVPFGASRLRRALVASSLGALIAAGPTWAQSPDEVDPPANEAAEAARDEAPSEPDEAAKATPKTENKPPAVGVEEIFISGDVSGIIAETDTPTSITGFDAADLAAMGVEDVSDIALYTPNLEIRTAGETSATFFIRGVGLSDFSSNAAGAVAVYQDGVPMNSPALQLAQVFDVESISVLRGPQSGGSGRNASAGAILVNARAPSFEYGGHFRASFGSIVSEDAKDAFGQDYEGALEVPVIADVLGTRLAFRLSDSDPYILNRCGGALPVGNPNRPAKICNENTLGLRLPIPGGLPRWVGESHDWAARGTLRFAPPGTEMDWLLNLHGRRLDNDATFGQAIGTKDGIFGGETSDTYTEPDSLEEKANLEAGGLSSQEAADVRATNIAENRPLDIRPFHGDYNRVGKTQLDAWGASLKGSIPLGPAELTSVTGFDSYDRFRDADQDFTPDLLFEARQTDSAWQFAQELGIAGELEDQPLRWEVGGNYLMEQLEANIFQQVGAQVPTLAEFIREYEQDLWSFALYGHVGFDFWEDFTLEAGLRYNWERKDFQILQFRPNIPLIPPRQNADTETWDAPTGTISLAYHFENGADIYWKYSRGFKAGHFNTNDPGQAPAKPEFIDAFEIGLKGQWWDGRLDLRGALFHYAYQDYQVFLFEDSPTTSPSLKIINANDARVIGAEADLVAQPLLGYVPDPYADLSLTLRFGWLETEFLDFTSEETAVNSNGLLFPIVADFSGNPLINAPELKLSGVAQWAFELGRYGFLIPRYDFTWTDDVFFDATGGRGSLDANGEVTKPEFAIGQPAFWLHNVRLGFVTEDDRLEVAGWCRNVTDERYKSYAFDTSRFSNVVINFVGAPRTCGGDIAFRW